MKTVVTGGSGFMGSHMAHLLRCLDHDVTVLTRRTGVSTLASLADILEDISVDELDLHDYNGLCRQVYGADVVFHYAAESHVTKSIENPEPFMYTNAIGTMHLLNACMDMDVPRVVLISSCEVYGEVPSMPPTGALGSTYIQREDYTPLCPKSPYAASKAAADTLAQSYIHTYDMPVVIVRPCNNFGPWQHEEKVIPRFIGQALRNEPITIHGRGLQKREWIYAPDCAEAVYAVHDAHPGIYNIGTGSTISIKEIAELIIEYTDSESEIIYTKDRDGQVSSFLLDTSKTQHTTGWVNCESFDERFKETIDWYRHVKS